MTFCAKHLDRRTYVLSLKRSSQDREMPKRSTKKRGRKSRRKTRLQRGGGGEEDWISLYNHVSSIPVFAILPHSSLCERYPCGIDGATADDTVNHKTFNYIDNTTGAVITSIPSFTVDKGTYIWNIVEAGDNCFVDDALQNAIKNNVHRFADALTLTNLDTDITINNRDSIYNLITNSKRATDCEYANISCSFNEYADTLKSQHGKNTLGVYIIGGDTQFINTDKSCFISNITTGGKDMFLSDIIKKVYSLFPPSVPHSAIFIFGGCSGSYKGYDDRMNVEATGKFFEHIDAAEHLIRMNHLNYATIHNTFTLSKKEINKIKGYEKRVFKDIELPASYTRSQEGMETSLNMVNSALEAETAILTARKGPLVLPQKHVWKGPLAGAGAGSSMGNAYLRVGYELPPFAGAGPSMEEA